MSVPDKLVIRTGYSNWRDYVPFLVADTTTNFQYWNPDSQYNDVNTAPHNEIAKQFSYFAAYWLNRNKVAVNGTLNVSVSSGGTFYFKALNSNPVTSYQGLYAPVNGSYVTLTLQQDGVDAGISASSAFTMQVLSGNWNGTASKKDVPGFPTSFMRTNYSWFVSAYFYTTSLNQGNWKPIVGSAYTTVSQTGFWGIWLSNPNDYIHWRNVDAPQFNGNTTLRVTSGDWHEVIVKYNPANKRELKFALRKQYDNTTITRQTVTQSADFSITGVLGNVTSGGWELSSQSMEFFHGKVERVTIGNIPTHTTLSQLLQGIYSNFEVPSSFTFNTTQIGENIMINIDKSSATLTSSPSSNISITKVSTDNWSVTISAVGTYTLTYTFVDPNDFFPTITTSASVKLVAVPATLTTTQSTFYRKFVSGASISFDVITSNAGTVTRTHESSNTSIFSIPTSSNPSGTIVAPGKITINVIQPATTNYTAVTTNQLITIIIVGSGITYSSETFPASFDLTGLNLSSSVFSNCNLTSANLTNANLTNSTFSNSTILTSANLFGATVNASTNLTTATLTNIQSGRIIGKTSLLPPNFTMI